MLGGGDSVRSASKWQTLGYASDSNRHPRGEGIGNAVGHNKSNQRVGAVLGAVLGRSIGRDIMRRNESASSGEYQTVQRCETVYQQHEEERLVGYQVTYLYNGEEYSVRTTTDPGDEIRVRVSVQPVL